MNNKPMILENNDLSEGVYTASGSGCYTAWGYAHQEHNTGRIDFRIQINGTHKADHTNEVQLITVNFNKEVEFASCGAATYESGNHSKTLVLRRQNRQNENDSIGFGDLIVYADPGLEVLSVKITD